MITTILAFTFKDKLSMIFMMITRVLYIPILISGFMLALYRVPRDPVLGSLKVILGLAVIALLEIGFARKNHHNLASNIIWSLVIVFALTSLVGLYLADWYFFWLINWYWASKHLCHNKNPRTFPFADSFDLTLFYDFHKVPVSGNVATDHFVPHGAVMSHTVSMRVVNGADFKDLTLPIVFVLVG